MGGEIDALGTLAEGALVGRAIDGGGHGHGHDLAECQNCRARLAGPFCHQCGQSGHVHRTLGHVVEEFAHGVFHVESRGWRTLPMLLVNPGRLTREYAHGRRARYIAPLALFLFMVFVAFGVYGLTGASVVNVDPAAMSRSIAESRAADVRKAERALAEVTRDPNATGAERAAAGRELARAREAQAGARSAGDGKGRAAGEAAVAGGGWADAVREANRRGDIKVNTGSARLDAAARHALENPELVAFKAQSKAVKFSFLLVPLTLPLMWLMFAARRGVTLYDHSVFGLYSLSFMALLASVAMLAGAAGVAAPWLVLLAPVHMFAQLRGAYRLGPWGAAWRTSVLSVACVIVLAMFVVAVAVVGMVN